MTAVTIHQALTNAQRTLVTSETPQLDAQVLLAHLLEKETTYLLAYPEQTLSDAQQTRYQQWIARRAEGEPVAYITGEKGFWDMTFHVTRDVLVPRPETEHLIEAAFAWAEGRDALTVADIGTGSGAIAVTIAQHLPKATVYATDISAAALQVARANDARYETGVHFLQGNLAQPLLDKSVRVDLLLANLPYIPADDVPNLKVSRHEPTQALAGGADGLSLVRELLAQVPQICNDSALILLEIGSGQGATVIEEADARLNIAASDLIYDYAGHDRVVRLQLR